MNAATAVWIVTVATSVAVFRDACRHRIGPATSPNGGRNSPFTPGAIAVLVLCFTVFALAGYLDNRATLIERAAKQPSDCRGFATYLAGLLVYTCVLMALSGR